MATPSTAQSEVNRDTLIKRVTRMLVREKPAAAAAPVQELPAKPAESEERRQERLEAYRKFCEEQSKLEDAGAEEKKAFKYRAPDFNK
jgi:hypothetical protein